MNAPRKFVYVYGCVLCALFAATADAAADDAFVGRWQAVRATVSGNLRSEDLFDYEFVHGADGLRFRDHGRFAMVGEPVAVTVSDDGVARAQWRLIMSTALSIEARVADDGRTLQATVRRVDADGSGGDAVPLSLERTPASLRAYFAPRLAANGERATSYRYAKPPAIDDGWRVASADAERLDRRLLERLVDDILREEDRVDARRTDAVLIARNGRLVFEEYFWGARRELVHAIASCTKSVASMLAGIAVDAGRLDVDELVNDHYPAYATSLWQREHYPLRVHDLLSMTAGIRWTDRSAHDGYTQRLFASADPAGFVMDLPLADPPGRRYAYNNGLPVLVGPILARAVGEPVEAFADRALFAPLRIRNYAWATLSDGTPMLTGGMVMTPRDMAKLGQLMLDGGVRDGRRLLSRDWIALSTSQQTRSDEYPYGYYWHLSDPERPWRGDPPSFVGPIERRRAFMAIGQGGQTIVVMPDAALVVVIVSSNWTPRMRDGFPTALLNRYVVPAIR